MKKFWPVIGLLVVITAFSFFIDENVRVFMLSAQNEQLNAAMLFFSALGGLTLGVPFIVAALIILEMKRKNKIAVNLLITLAIDIVLTTVLKLVIGRGRPDGASDSDALEVYLPSFPSAHSSRAFAMFSLLDYYYKKPALLYSIATLVALSRVYFGVHHLSDVLAGMITGLLVARFVTSKNLGERLSRMFKKKQ
ncbi:MAG: phosphatase PAP2 family protein [archaeon]